MRRSGRWRALLILVPFLLAGTPTEAGDVNLLYGRKALSENSISDLMVEDQTEFGLAASLDVGLPFLLAVDLLSSSESSRIGVEATNPTVLETKVDTLELNVGVRQVWGKRAQPFVGAGLAWIELGASQFASEEVAAGSPRIETVIDDKDGGLGFWIEFGFMYRIGRGLNLGIDGRFSQADASLNPEGFPGSVKLDSGGLHGLLLVGYHW